MQTRRRAVQIGILGLAVLLLFIGSAYAKKDKEKDDKTQSVTVKVLKPSLALELADAATSAQEIGGVRVELTRVPLETKPMVNVDVGPRESAWESWTGVRVGTAAPVWIVALPYYDVQPGNLQFKVKITNHLGKVLRLQGVALQFTKDGESVPTDNVQNELNKVMILPEKSWEGTLHGPTLELFGLKKQVVAGGDPTNLPEFAAKEGNLFLGLYDVVTELDQASNPVKRSNFEWIFGYKTGYGVEDATAMKIKGRLTEEQAKQMKGDFPADKFTPPQ